jgi:RNA polymerase sigma factor (sigma-70 family)
VLQEICIKVIRKIGTLKQQESFRPWVACLARREALRWRNLNMRRGISLDHENAEEPPDPKALSVDEQLAEDEERAQVLDAIAQLPRKYKEVLLLYHSGQTYKQIAETLELTMTTVQIRIVRARRMIMDTINEQLSRRIQHESARRPSRAAHP